MPGWLGATLVIVAVFLVILIAGIWFSISLLRKYCKSLSAGEEAQLERIANATVNMSRLSFSMCFVPFGKLQSHGSLLKHEVARDSGYLVVADDFEMLHRLLVRYPTVFISHQ